MDNFIETAEKYFNAIKVLPHDKYVSEQLQLLKAQAGFNPDSDEPIFLELKQIINL